MRKKEELLKAHNDDNYKPIFLLAWARFLNYKELQYTDNLEPYLAEKLAKRIKKIADWDSLVIEYNEANVKRAFCIAIYNAIKDAEQEDSLLAPVYADDIMTWLYILEDDTFEINDKMTRQELRDIYEKISTKYKFNL